MVWKKQLEEAKDNGIGLIDEKPRKGAEGLHIDLFASKIYFWGIDRIM